MVIETVVALLMIIHGEIKEHRIQESMAVCLRGKRTAERQYSQGTKYQCLKVKAELESNIDGSQSIKKIILE
jgi:hypothetical protein